MKRILVLGGILVLVIIVAAAFFLVSSLDRIVKAAIEKIGSDVTGTRVQVDEVDISLSDGEGALRGFRVTNPDGFEDEDAFQFDEITMKIDLTTLTEDPVVIEEIVVQAPRIRYELGDKGTNVGEIQKAVEESSSGSETAGPNLIIRSLHFRDGEVNVAGAQLLRKGFTAALPNLHLTDIGGREGGASAEEVVQRILTELGRKVAKAAGSVDVDEMAEELEERAKDAAGKLKGLLKQDN